MKCPICEVQFIGFIGASCTCGPTKPEPETPTENGITVDGIQVVHEGVTIVHTGG